MRLRIRTDPFPGIYELDEPEVIGSALFGPCLRGWYRLEGSSDPWQLGDFRLDRANLLEPALQMELAA